MLLRKTISFIAARPSVSLLAGLTLGPVVLAMLVPAPGGGRGRAVADAPPAAIAAPAKPASAADPGLSGQGRKGFAHANFVRYSNAIVHEKNSARRLRAQLANTGAAKRRGRSPGSVPGRPLPTRIHAPSERSGRGLKLVYQFLPGERCQYRIDYANSSATDFRAVLQNPNGSGAGQNPSGAGLVNAYQSGIQGDLIVTVLERKSDGALLACRLAQPVVRLDVNGQPSAAEAAQIQTDLGREFLVHVSPRGQVLSVRFDPSVSSLAQSFARALLAETQVVLPDHRAVHGAQWVEQEADANGQYVARYDAEPVSRQRGRASAAVQTLRKRIARYLPAPQQPGAHAVEVPMLIHPQGSLVARFDARRGELISLTGAEAQVMTVQGKQVARAKTTLRMELQSETKVGADELAALRSAASAPRGLAAAVSLSPRQSRDESERLLQRNELGNATIDSLLADLAKAETEKASDREQTALYLKFKALVYLHPEACARLGQILIGAAPRSMTMAMLAGALGSMGTAPAQAALAHVIQARSHEVPVLMGLIPLLAGAGSPTPVAVTTLRDLEQHSRDATVISLARLALGAMARQLATAEPKRAAELVDGLVAQIRGSRSKADTRQLLLALGNAGSVRALPVLKQFAASPSIELRGVAAFALRWVPSAQVDALLARMLQTDRDSRVRGESASALGYRAITAATFAVEKRAFATEKATDVRLALMANLWKARAQFPEARAILARAAAKDASREVRKAAGETLASEAGDAKVAAAAR